MLVLIFATTVNKIFIFIVYSTDLVKVVNGKIKIYKYKCNRKQWPCAETNIIFSANTGTFTHSTGLLTI